jgi:hypothetical protein
LLKGQRHASPSPSLDEIFERPEEAEAAADVLADAPPEFAALSALVLGVFERLSRQEARA